MVYKNFYDAFENIKEEEKLDYCMGILVITQNKMKFHFLHEFKHLGDKLLNPLLKKNEKEQKTYDDYQKYLKEKMKIIKTCYNFLKKYSFDEWLKNSLDIESFELAFILLYQKLPEFRQRSDVKNLYKLFNNRYNEIIKKETGKYPHSKSENNPNYINEFMVKQMKESDFEEK